MRIFKDFNALDEIRNPVLTIGTFDGVHLGHQKILERVNQEAAQIDGESVLFTFYPHPKMVLFPDSSNLKLIQTQNEKLEKLSRYGLDNVIVFPFTREFSRLTAVEFVRDYLVNRLKVKKLVIGYDHQFGKNREGTLEFLKSVSDVYDFEVIEIPAQEIDEVNVSSTKVRNALLSGDVSLAAQFLGEPFELNGTVGRGDQIGRKLGYPTANLIIESAEKIIPGNGVYVVKVRLSGGEWNGMMNIGFRPTIGTDEPIRSLEIHILDFNGDIYDQEISVQLLSRLRDEKKFNSLEDLSAQLKRDENTARDFFVSELH
jgi:riboflavin kinase / FMN adenylyltransferase